MKEFMVLYMAPGAAYEAGRKNCTPEQQRESMDAWIAWMDGHEKSILDGGAPLGRTVRVDATGVSDTKNEVGGYSIVEAESHEAAAKLFGHDHPHLQMPGAWIEIVEIMDIPGM